jgi:uncharacterized protein YbjT (DUF2867 family)
MTALGVTGSTGRLGGRVARLLAESGVEQRLLLRDPSRAPDLPGTTVAGMTYADGASVEAACRGLDVVWMVSASEDEHRLALHRTFVDAVAAAGVRHVVYTSFYGAAPDATFTLARDHFHTEEHLKASGTGWTMVRDNLYLDFLPYFAGDDRVLRGPAGDGRVAAVSLDDIAASLHAVLLDPGAHTGATYSLTGPEALSLREAAAIMTRETGEEHRYVDETLEEAHASRATYGAPDWQVEAWVSTYTAIARGELADVTDDVRRLSGRSPIGLAELMRKNAAQR